MSLSSNKTILILLAVALVGGVLSFVLTTGSSGDGSAEGRKVSSKVIKAKKKPAAAKRSAIRVASTRSGEGRKPVAVKGGGDFMGEDVFNEMPDFSFDEEKEAVLSESVKAVILDLRKAMSGFEPDRKRVFAALQKLQALIAKGVEVPAFAKIEALTAARHVGIDAMSEAVGFLADPDPSVRQAAKETITGDMMMDINASEDDLMAAVMQMVKLQNLTPAECEDLMFTVSTFKNSNKVKVGCEILDNAGQTMRNSFAQNTDFIYEEADVESIKTKADIIKYGKEHPDGSGTDFELKFE